MFYLLLLVLVLVLIYVIRHIIGSLVSGCLTVATVFMIGLLGFFLIKSTRETVYVLGYYQIDNFKVEKINR